MFNWLRKDPVRQLQTDYLKKLEEARDLQRGGDIQGFAAATAQAEEIARRIEELKQPSQD